MDVETGRPFTGARTVPDAARAELVRGTGEDDERQRCLAPSREWVSYTSVQKRRPSTAWDGKRGDPAMGNAHRRVSVRRGWSPRAISAQIFRPPCAFRKSRVRLYEASVSCDKVIPLLSAMSCA